MRLQGAIQGDKVTELMKLVFKKKSYKQAKKQLKETTFKTSELHIH